MPTDHFHCHSIVSDLLVHSCSLLDIEFLELLVKWFFPFLYHSLCWEDYAACYFQDQGAYITSDSGVLQYIIIK